MAGIQRAPRDWKVIIPGKVIGDGVRRIEFTCTKCGVDSMLPVIGLALAQLEDGIVFDTGTYATPDEIQCPNCRRVLSKA